MSLPLSAIPGSNVQAVDAFGWDGNGPGAGAGPLLHLDSFTMESWIELYHTVKLAVMA